MRMVTPMVLEVAAAMAKLALMRRSNAKVFVMRLQSDALDGDDCLGLYTKPQLQLVGFSPVKDARLTTMTTIQHVFVMFDPRSCADRTI